MIFRRERGRCWDARSARKAAYERVTDRAGEPESVWKTTQ
jgi:hypothetical protein